MIGLLSCRTIGDTEYILSNVSYLCYTDSYSFYSVSLVLPALITWIITCPYLIYRNLNNNRRNLDVAEVKINFGFLKVILR